MLLEQKVNQKRKKSVNRYKNLKSKSSHLDFDSTSSQRGSAIPFVSKRSARVSIRAGSPLLRCATVRMSQRAPHGREPAQHPCAQTGHSHGHEIE
jgi:hypothetical protein